MQPIDHFNHSLRQAWPLALVSILALFAASPAMGQFVEPEVTVLTSLAAENPGDSFGWVAEALGDLDGDGAPDYVIGAIANADGGPFAGKAYVYSGASGALLATHGGLAGERLGFSVTGGADFDGDAVPDYAIGAPGFFGNASRVLVISGADHSVIRQHTDGVGTLFGFDVNLAGDVDGDGTTDLVVGAATAAGFAGRVDVYSGASGALLWSTPGPTANGFLGAGISGLDDLNGDGVPEQGGGAPGAGPATGGVTTGAAYILDGATGAVVRKLLPTGTGGAFGQFFVHDAGDVDADGVGDVYVGDFADSRGGRGHVYSGDTGERLRLFTGETTSDGLGMGRGAGDIDGDGHADLLVGAFLNSGGAPQGGKCWIFSGKNGQTLATFTSTVPNGQVGFDVVTLGDVNGDGRTDFLLTGLDLAFVVAGP